MTIRRTSCSPPSLAKGMDDVGNIDEGGNNYPTDGTGVDRSEPAFADEDTDEKTDTSSTNVGDLNRGNFRPVSFNHLTGHFTEALIGNPAGGSDPDRVLGRHSYGPSGHGHERGNGSRRGRRLR